jgi:hydrogenase maturation protease
MTHPRTLVMGIGNLLMGDEGIGVHAVREILEGLDLPPDIAVIDGGTGGFHLLSYFSDYARVIMIDATMDGQEDGTVTLIEPRYASDFPRSLTAHDIGLRDLVESAALLGHLPKVYLVTVSISDMQPMRVSLSPGLQAAVPRVVGRVADVVAAVLAEDAAALA